MGTTTPYHGFYIPAQGETGWDDEKNADWTALDTRVVKKGIIANRPAAGTSGRWFLSTDETPPTLYYDTGTQWTQVGATTTVVEEEATQVVADVTTLNFGEGFAVADDGGGAVTVTSDHRYIDRFPITDLGVGEQAEIPVYVAAGETLTVWEMGVMLHDGAAPSANLDIEVYDVDGDTIERTYSVKRQAAAPIDTFTGENQYMWRLVNNTTSQQSAGGYVKYDLTDYSP